MENNSKEVLLKFFESNDHPIDSDTRKHKVQLLLYSFLMWLCFFIKDQDVIMILGVKFEKAISPLELVPFIFILVIYHFILFVIQLDSSLNNWKAKKIKSKSIPYIISNKNEIKDKYSLNMLEINNNNKIIKPNLNILEKEKEKLEKSFEEIRSSHQKFEKNISSLAKETISVVKPIRGEYNENTYLNILNKLSENYLCYHKELKEAYDKIKKGGNPNENLTKLESYFTWFDEGSINIISQVDEFSKFYNDYNKSYNILLAEKDIFDDKYNQFFSLYESSYKCYHQQFQALIAEIEAIEFKEGWFNLKLPFIVFPIVFGLSSFIPLFIYICDTNK